MDLAPASPRTARRDALLVAAAAVAAMAAAPWCGFAWDDLLVILRNPALHGSPLDLLTGIDAARTTEVTPFYRPLTLLTFLVETRLHGPDPAWMHLLNLGLHVLVAVLVSRLALAASGDRRVALAAGLLHAVHPVDAEAVAFLSGGRNTLLAAAFGLAALLLHRAARGAPGGRGRTGPAVAAALSLLAALLSKETALPVLLFMAAAEWPAFQAEGAAAEPRRRAALGRLALLGAAVVTWLVLRQRALAGAGAGVEILDGLPGRLADLLYVVPRGLLTIAWPPASSPRYFIPGELAPLAWPLLLGWGAILAGLAWCLGPGRSPATRLGLAWLAAFWLPVSGIVPFPGVPLADRYLYLPAVGLWLVLADQAVRLADRAGPRARPALAGAGGALLLALGGYAVVVTRAWRDDVTLSTRVVARYPDQAFGHHNLGTALLDLAGDLDGAEREFRRALAIDPAFPRLHTQLGYVRLKRGDYAGALAEYRQALALDPADAEALFNTALASERLGDWPGAIAFYRRFLEVPPGELEAARPQAEEKLRLLPLLLPR